jgi:hypothetical protein
MMKLTRTFNNKKLWHLKAYLHSKYGPNLVSDIPGGVRVSKIEFLTKQEGSNLVVDAKWSVSGLTWALIIICSIIAAIFFLIIGGIIAFGVMYLILVSMRAAKAKKIAEEIFEEFVKYGSGGKRIPSLAIPPPPPPMPAPPPPPV